MHLEPEEIDSVEIINPIVLGNSTDDKTFILDIRVCLNNHTILNLEMQVVNQHNWAERSLSYLCRNFDNLEAGKSYEDIKPVIQVGILNFTLFEEHPEFYATYQLLNVKDYTLYSDKLRLSVLDLTRYRLSQEEQIRMECEAREDYYRTQIGIQRKLARLEELEKKKSELVDSLEKTEGSLKEVENCLKEKENSLKETENSLRETENSLETEKAINKMLENKNEALVSQMEKLLAWAKEHGYETIQEDESIS